MFVVNIYYVIGVIMFFVGVLSLNEVGKKNKWSKKLRTYFNFIDNKMGLGIFMVFMTCLMIEVGGSEKLFVIISAIVNFVIAAINLFFGCNEESFDLPQNPFVKTGGFGGEAQ